MFVYMQTVNAQISLRIRAVSSGRLLSANHKTLQNVLMISNCQDDTLCMCGLNLKLCILRMLELSDRRGQYINKSQKGLLLETKNTQNHENRRLGLIESLYMQHCRL